MSLFPGTGRLAGLARVGPDLADGALLVLFRVFLCPYKLAGGPKAPKDHLGGPPAGLWGGAVTLCS